MDSHQHQALLRMFMSRRLMPWVPEHDLFIKAEIARLEVLEPNDAHSFAEFYEKRLEDHLAEQDQEVIDEKIAADNEKAFQKAEMMARLSVAPKHIDPEPVAPVASESVAVVPEEEEAASEAVVEEPKPKKRGRKPKNSVDSE